jgi:hypothetical protein
MSLYVKVCTVDLSLGNLLLIEDTDPLMFEGGSDDMLTFRLGVGI